MVEQSPTYKEQLPPSLFNVDVWLPFYLPDEAKESAAEFLSHPTIEYLNVASREQTSDEVFAVAGSVEGPVRFGGVTGEKPQAFLDLPHNFIQVATGFTDAIDTAGRAMLIYRALGWISRRVDKMGQGLHEDFNTALAHSITLGDSMSVVYKLTHEDKSADNKTLGDLNRIVRAYYKI